MGMGTVEPIGGVDAISFIRGAVEKYQGAGVDPELMAYILEMCLRDKGSMKIRVDYDDGPEAVCSAIDGICSQFQIPCTKIEKDGQEWVDYEIGGNPFSGVTNGDGSQGCSGTCEGNA